MKIIYNTLIPFPGFTAINLFGFIFARDEYKPLEKRTLNREAIHTAQMKELLSGGGCETIGQLLVQEMEKQKNKKRTFIIEYEVNLGRGYTIQEVIAEALIVKYSSLSSDKDDCSY